MLRIAQKVKVRIRLSDQGSEFDLYRCLVHQRVHSSELATKISLSEPGPSRVRRFGHFELMKNLRRDTRQNSADASVWVTRGYTRLSFEV